MPSLITGYEYDIFISYRQKDNKHDGWVTEFVDNLKGELEATFKEEISVYFDINPHDGLLETHDVDESLKEKLKCLVFIPIISRTYCDPKAFAWEHEFKAFVEKASKDEYGLKVKLPNGNVASRVLPVRIHDLDNEDIAQCESVLGGVLRGIEFIYKSPGVNRPLLPKENNPQENLNHTDYRDQINKVANTIKEIISAIQHYNPQQDKITQEVSNPVNTDQKNKKAPIIITSIVALALIILGVLFIPKLFKPSEQLEKSIAVLPFENLSSDEEQVWFSDGITDIIINQLSKISEFRVLGRTTILRYREEQKSIQEIGKELDVNYVIEGTVQRQGERMRISVQLIRVINEGHIWSDIYDRDWKDIFQVQSEIAQKIAEKLKSALTPEEKTNIETSGTKNPEAYNLYLKGRYFWDFRTEAALLKAIDFFNQAIVQDSSYALAYSGLADSYSMLVWYAAPLPPEFFFKAEQAALQALEIDGSLAETHTSMGYVNYNAWKFEAAEKEYLKAIELDPEYSTVHHWYAMLLACTGRFDQAINEISEAHNLDPLSLVINRNLGVIYICARKYDDAIEALNEVSEINPEFSSVQHNLSLAYLNKGMYEDALSVNKSSDNYLTGIIYFHLGHKEKANQILNELVISSKTEYISPTILALLYFSLGNKEMGFTYMERAYEIHDLQLTEIRMHLRIHPGLDEITSDPRFIDLTNKMGLMK